MINPSDILDLNQEFNPESALKESIVRHDENIEQAETLVWVNDNGEFKSICTRGNISTILGKAKSRKTFFITMLCSSMLVGLLFNKIKGRKVFEKIVIFDTEQGRYRAQRVLFRVAKLAGMNNNFEVLSLRKYDSHQRLQIIQKYFEKNKVAFAIIDGVRDLVADFNNLEQSNDIVTELMRISEVYNCHLCLVIHMNKGDNNARGHLGTELINKAETVLSVNKEKGSNYSDVSPEYTRDEDFEPFQFTVKEGLPVVVGYESTIVDGKLVNEYEHAQTKDINPNYQFEQQSEKQSETPF